MMLNEWRQFYDNYYKCETNEQTNFGKYAFRKNEKENLSRNHEDNQRTMTMHLEIMSIVPNAKYSENAI